MYLQIKKTDSVTSILMFLFNVFLTPMGIKEITIKNILQMLKPFDKSETSIRMGLSRGVRNGVLTKVKRQGEVFYMITSSAEEYFSYWWETMQQFHARIPRQYNNWDKMWTLAHVRGDSIEEIIALLKKQGFGSLNRNLWISPYDITAQTIDGTGKLTEEMYLFRSKLTKPNCGEMIRVIWNPEKINGSYEKYVNELEKAASDLDSTSVNQGQSLPVLHLFGIRLFGIIQEDAQLPMEILPKDWMGIEAAERFEKIRGKYLPGAVSYIKQIIEQG